jgi:nitrate/nitrite transport system ATP-binding protein
MTQMQMNQIVPTPTPALSVSGVHKAFGSFVALEGVDLDIWPGEFISIIGHSGCGKSTLLNLVAGLNLPTAGTVSLFGRPIEGPGPERAMVFQNYSLLPWLSVKANVLEAMKASVPQMGRDEREQVCEQVLKMVGLWSHRDQKPGSLSGGQRQRVAIARAFAVQPRVLLLDEPFGALDAITRGKLQDELLGMWSGPESSISNVLMVTHDIDEAIYLSDRIVVMSNGPRAHIHEVLKVNLERPRERAKLVNDPIYLALKAHMLDLLGRVLAH